MQYEQSFNWDIDDIITMYGAVTVIGNKKKDTNTLKDLVSNNDCTINGAMPTNGFINARRFTSANDDYLDCGNDSSLSPQDMTIVIDFMFTSFQNTYNGLIGNFRNGYYGYQIHVQNNGTIWFSYANIDGDMVTSKTPSGSIVLNKYHQIVVTNGISSGNIYVDGVDTLDVTHGEVKTDSSSLTIGKTYTGSPSNAVIQRIELYNIILTSREITEHFNAIAVLPLWQFTASIIPSRSTLSNFFMGTSAQIQSGAFEITEGLNCVSAGQLVFSASNEFDGAEYVKVKIGGTWYAGAGTITQENTTVSVTQGSNNITVDMGSNDLIQDILIQFRKEVSQ